MRIVAGKHRSRLLKVPPGRIVRPTADRAREALFSLLASARFAPDLEDARVVDAFAGSGALGFEALSRGAAHACFIETNPACLRVIAQNAELLKEAERTTILKAGATRPPPAPRPCQFAFLDPPYDSGFAPAALIALARAGWLAPKAVAAVEVAAAEKFQAPPGFQIEDERVYGAARLIFLTAPG